MKVYITTRDKVYQLRDDLAKMYTDKPYTITRNYYGKPYVKDDLFYFSISYTGNVAAFIIGDGHMGVDIESLEKERKHSSILYHTTLAEAYDIHTYEDFIYNWTAKEAFVKYVGASMFAIFKKIEYYNGEMTYYFKPTGSYIVQAKTKYGIVSVCREVTMKGLEVVDLIENEKDYDKIIAKAFDDHKKELEEKAKKEKTEN